MTIEEKWDKLSEEYKGVVLLEYPKITITATSNYGHDYWEEWWDEYEYDLSYEYEADFDSVRETLDDRYYPEIKDDAKRDRFLLENFDTVVINNYEYLLEHFRKWAEEKAFDNFNPDEDEWDARRPV